MSNGMLLTTQRMSYLHLYNSRSQNANGLVLVHHDSQKNKKAVNFIGPVVTKVLDTFSTIQYMTICCLYHANIIMPSAIWLKLSNSRVAPSQETKMSLRTPGPLYTHTWKFGHETTVPGIHPNSVLWGTLACSLTAKLEEHLASLLYRASPYHESHSAPSFHDYVLVWGVVCVKFFKN